MFHLSAIHLAAGRVPLYTDIREFQIPNSEFLIAKSHHERLAIARATVANDIVLFKGLLR